MRDSDQGDTQVSVRLPTPLVRALEAKAAEADRTLSGEVRHALRRHIENNTPSHLPSRERPA